MAWFCGLPAWTSVLMFLLMAFLLLPFTNGMVIFLGLRQILYSCPFSVYLLMVCQGRCCRLIQPLTSSKQKSQSCQACLASLLYGLPLSEPPTNESITIQNRSARWIQDAFI